MYNKTVKALVEYEILWTASWLGSVYKAYTRLSAPILSKDPKSGQAHLLSLHLLKKENLQAHCQLIRTLLWALRDLGQLSYSALGYHQPKYRNSIISTTFGKQ